MCQKKKNLGEFIGGARAHSTPVEGSAVPCNMGLYGKIRVLEPPAGDMATNVYFHKMRGYFRCWDALQGDPATEFFQIRQKCLKWSSV